MTDSIQALREAGQSLWYDNIHRQMLESGELEEMIQQGWIRGVTSNPSIFRKAIVESDHYDEQLRSLADQGLSAEKIYEAMAFQDIQAAADLFRTIYDETEGYDGYVSLEVNPNLAYDTEASIEEAQRLWGAVDRPNLMVKIPATKAGLPAIAESIAAGVNINVTLIFSRARYADVMAAYIEGLERRRKAKEPIEDVRSVASFFVSRVDTKVDERLEAVIRSEAPTAPLAVGIRGKAAVANTKVAYLQFLEVFEEDGAFADLRGHGGQIQRPLWASTSTKNSKYSDVKYVEELIAPMTVNTVPQRTLEAFLDHGEVSLTIDDDLEGARFVLQSLDEVGISMDEVTDELEAEGVQAFADSYNQMIEAIEARL